MTKLLFESTIRDIKYLKERGYLSEKGLEWLEDLERLGDKDENTNVECEQ